MFRKVGDKSSEFMPDCNSVRQDGSYIYEDFMATEGTDVKVCGLVVWNALFILGSYIYEDFMATEGTDMKVCGGVEWFNGWFSMCIIIHRIIYFCCYCHGSICTD